MFTKSTLTIVANVYLVNMDLMSYHKENLKEQFAAIAWDICKAQSWQKVNMQGLLRKLGFQIMPSIDILKTKMI